MPSRRLITFRPAVPDDTALDVAITVIRLTARATPKSRPSPALRNGTRKTPPPMPSSDPSPPATAPAAMTAAMTVGCIISAGSRILSYVPTVLRRRARAGVVPGRLRSHQPGGGDRSAARRLGARSRRAAARRDDRRGDRDPRARRLRVGRARARARRARGSTRARARISSTTHHAVRDGETLPVGDLTLTFLHTPGHTPEHICDPRRSARRAGAPVHRRPALRRRRRPAGSRSATPRRAGSRTTCSIRSSGSWRSTIAIEVHPGHGAGSLCGAGIGKEPSSTIGARAPAERDAAVSTIATRSSPPCWPTSPRRRRTSRG